MGKNIIKRNNPDQLKAGDPDQFKDSNPENQNHKTHWSKRLAHAVNLLPAVLVASLVLTMIPQTRPVLDQVPALLTAKVEAAQTTEATEEESGEAESQAQGNYEDGVYTGQASGYGGPVKVEVTVKDRSIKSVGILSASKETPSFFNRAKGVINQVLLKQTWEVDTVSGATYSSRGILGAIQNALTGQKVENDTAAEEAPVKQSDVAFEEPSSYKDGTYTGTARGFGGNII
ncbi:MAG: FMN-binding protein, partial [Lachnospiraceae bacterium]|nr:FMN-binding protein [Lachnospiraceae bacterium]